MGTTEGFFSPKVRKKIGCPLPLIQNNTRSLSHSSQTTKINKTHPNQQERSKILLYSDDMILYVENSKDYTKEQLKPLNKFSKVTGHKINVQKSVAFLYHNNEAVERKKIRKQFLLHLNQKQWCT